MRVLQARSSLGALALAIGFLSCSDPALQEELLGSSASPIEMGSPATMYPEAVYVLGDGFIPCSGVVLAPLAVLTAGHCGTAATTYVVTAPHAGNQVVHGASGWSPYAGNAAKTPDVRLIFLDEPIRLSTYPVLSKTEVAAGTKVVDIGRTLNGSINDNDYVSPPVQILGTAAPLGYPFNYEAQPDISQDGDSGGPIELVGSGPHTVVAIVDTDTIEQSLTEPTPIDMFARLDHLASDIEVQIAAHEKEAGASKDAGKAPEGDIGGGYPTGGGGGCSVARFDSRPDAGIAGLLLLVFTLSRPRRRRQV
jgi:hypothetical protein